jgi:uncharacterized protein
MRQLRRKLIVGALSASAFVLATASVASAHVTVNPKTADQGGYAKLTFRVPNERPDAQTTKLEIDIPTDKPIASISVQPQPGWTYVVEKTKLDSPVSVHGTPLTDVVSKVTWTAEPSAALKTGEFGEFNISAGPLPTDASSITFKALQTYSSGEVVRWIDVAEKSAEVDHPAPTLTLTAATTTDDSHHDTTKNDEDNNDDDANVLSIAAIAASILAVAISLGALLTHKK